MKIVAVIPARMKSSRFPGKPLAMILGKSMIEHVYRRARLSTKPDEVYIATCDQEIQTAAENFGAPVVMTASTHERCVERVAEAVEKIPCDIAVVVQGDEPLLKPSMIDEVLAPLITDTNLPCTNLMAALDPLTPDFQDPNVIKVVCTLDGNALYMSREPIPTRRLLDDISVFRQLGIIAFRRDCLMDYARLKPTPLECAESVDMLRLIQNGVPVRMVLSKGVSVGVDTPEGLDLVVEQMPNDPVYALYR